MDRVMQNDALVGAVAGFLKRNRWTSGFMLWYSRSIKNKLIVLGLLGIFEALIINVIILAGPMRSVFEDFLSSNQQSVEELRGFSGSLRNVQAAVEQSIGAVADENSAALLADVKLKLGEYLNLYGKQVSDALDQWTEYLVAEQGKGLLTNSALARIVVQTKNGITEINRGSGNSASTDPASNNSVNVVYVSETLNKHAATYKDFSGVRQVNRDGMILLEGVTQIPVHGATVILQLDVSKTLAGIEKRKNEVISKMNTQFREGTEPLFAKVKDLQETVKTKGDRVRASVFVVIGAIVFLDLLLLVVGGAIALYMAKSMVRPLRLLVDAANELSNGNFDIKVRIDSEDEISRLSDCFVRMAASLRTSHANQQKLNIFTRSISVEESENEVMQKLHIACHDILDFDSIVYVDFTKPGARESANLPIMVLERPEGEQPRSTALQTLAQNSLWRRCEAQIADVLCEGMKSESLLLTKISEGSNYVHVGCRFCFDAGVPSFGVLVIRPQDMPWNPLLVSLFENIVIGTSMALGRLASQSLRKEVYEASELQAFLMAEPHHSDCISLHLKYHQATNGGGDWCYTQEIGQYYVFMIADVTGHGVPAAILTAFGRGCVSTMAQLLQSESIASHEVTPARMLSLLDTLTHATTKGRIGMTALALMINLKTGEAIVANAGHCPLFVIRAEKNAAGQNLETLPGAGNRIGYTKEGVFPERRLILEPRDRIFLYTDGLFESMNSEGRVFGRARLRKLLASTSSQDSPEMIAKIEEELFEFVRGHGLDDDVMLAFIDFKARMKA